jgi:hypothetical protein
MARAAVIRLGLPAMALAMIVFAVIAPGGAANELHGARGSVTTEAALRRAWADPMRRRIDLRADIVLHDCSSGDPLRESPFPSTTGSHA